MSTWLVDTGPLVAYLDRADPEHALVEQRWDAFDGSLATTCAVITEAMYFVGETAGGPRLLTELVTASRMRVHDVACLPAEMDEAVRLMAKYADTPMDFADATLLLLAEAIGARDLLTLDRRGFTVFRTRRKQALRLVLDSPRD